MNELEQGDQELQALADRQLSGSRGSALPATFSIEATHDEAKSKKAGRPVYVDTEVIEIRVGIDTIRHPVNDEDRRTYAAQYLAWKKGESQEAVEGMPLGQWTAIPGKALAKEFAHFGIRTVEQLAAASDSTLQRIGPHLALRQKARDWLADAEKQAPLIRLRDENEALKNRLAALESMVQRQTQDIESARQGGGVIAQAPAMPDIAALIAEQVKAALAAVPQPAPKKRGRPPKVKPAEEAQ